MANPCSLGRWPPLTPRPPFPGSGDHGGKGGAARTSAGLTAVAAKNRQRLEFYRAAKPYHEPAPTGNEFR